MYDVITIGSATQDVYLQSKAFRIAGDRRSPTGKAESFAFGSKTEVEHILLEVGGGATNTAVTFAHLGLRTACVCKVGQDAAGDEVIRALRRYKVDPRFVVRDPDDHTALSTIFLSPSGERTVLVYRGASADFTERMVVWSKLQSRWFYVTSLGGNMSFLRRALAHAHRTGAKIAVNPGKAELQQRAALGILRSADILLLNNEEAKLLFRAKGRALQKKIATWRKGIVVVTDGERGAWTVTPHSAWQLHITPVKAVDTTGAGDAFGSGFVGSLAKRPDNIGNALRFAAMNAASEVRAIGAKNGLLANPLSNHKLPRITALHL